MRKILILITVLVMALSAMPVYAVETIYMEHTDQCCYNVANPEMELRTSFDSCPVPGCGGLVVLSCSSNLQSENEPASIVCTFSQHNVFEKCNLYTVKYYNSGRCNKCDTPIEYLIANYGYSNTTHVHGRKHIFSVGNGNYTTQYTAVCYI